MRASLHGLVAFFSCILLAAACGSSEEAGRGSGGFGAGSDESNGAGGAPTGSGSGVGAGYHACPGCTVIGCVCPDGTTFDMAPCVGVAMCASPSCSELEASYCQGNSASGQGSGASTGPSGSTSAVSSVGSTSVASTGSGGYDPYCVQVADHECEVCNPNDSRQCKRGDGWEFMASSCDVFQTGCPGYLGCILAASTCNGVNQCPCDSG